MRSSGYQLQFKDNFFINKLIHSQANSIQRRNQSQKTLSRSMWTNKIKRQKINCLKLGSKQTIFGKAFFEEEKQQTFNLKSFATNRPISLTNHQSNQLVCRKMMSTSSTQRNSSKPDSHFFISRNVSPQLGRENKQKLNILQESVQVQFEKENMHRSGDPRYILKNLKIKNNINIYKGNFSKFTKKIMAKPEQLKKRHITSDSSVSPWDVTEKSTQHCL